MQIERVGEVLPVSNLESKIDIKKSENSAKGKISFSQVLANIRQAETNAQIAEASKSANLPPNASLGNLNSSLNGDYIESLKIQNPTPDDRVATPKGDAAKSLRAKDTTIDKTSKLYEKSLELESYFVKILIQSMRKTLTGTTLAGDESYASKMYKDMMYDQLSRTVTQNAGFGLADQIYLELK